MKSQWHVIERRSAQAQPEPERCKTETQWDRWLDSDRRVDPYLMWAELTRFVGFGGLGRRRDGESFDSNSGHLPILVELAPEALKLPALPCLSAGVALSESTGECPPEFAHFEIQAAYLDLVKPGKVRLRRRFVTGRVLPSCVNALYAHAMYVRRFQLGLPRLPGSAAARAFGIDPVASDKPQTVIGLIDDGFAFAHDQLLDDLGVSRVWALWDQDAGRTPDGRHWKPAGQPTSGATLGTFAYGAQVDHVSFKAIVTLGRGDPSPHASLGPYRELRYLPIAPDPELHATRPPEGVSDLTMLPATHGTAVADLAAGRVPPLGHFSTEQSTHVPVLGDSRASLAAAWPLILVQLPTRTSLDTSGGSLGVHVLDGVRYIVDKARSIPPRRSPHVDPNKPIAVEFSDPGDQRKEWRNDVIINISYGAVAGPHDGTSILEQALDDIAAGQWPGSEVSRIVVSAGNAHGSMTHARLRLHRGQVGKAFTWTLGADNPHESYLEIWLPPRASEADRSHPLSADDFTFWVQPPGFATAQKVVVGAAAVLQSGDGATIPVAAAVFARHVAQGENGTMLFLAAAPTRRALAGAEGGAAAARPCAPHGPWSVTVAFGAASAPVPTEVAVVHAWAERSDLVYGTARAQQSRVESDDPVPPPTEHFPSVREFCRHAGRPFTDEAPAPFAPDFSFGSLAGGRRAAPSLHEARQMLGAVVSVAGFRAADLEMATYSSGGPARGSDTDMARLPEALCGGEAGSEGEGEDERRAPRSAADLDAASDVGTAMRGLRTAGTAPGLVSRLSGTSAAAACATRAIAESFFVRTQPKFELDPPQFCKPERLEGTRATLTPHKDDRYRRGRRRVAAQIAVKRRP